MVHKPTIPIRFASGVLSGVGLITARNADGSVSFKNIQGSIQNINIPNVTKSTFAVGDAALPSADDSIILPSN